MSVRDKIKKCDVKRLIRLVESKPALYNSNLKEHNDKNYIDDCWRKIGKELKCSPSECRIKWSVLRCSYSRSLRRKALTCSKKNWYLADSMSFLKNYLRWMEKGGNDKEKCPSFSDNDNQSLQSIESDLAKEISQKPNGDLTLSNALFPETYQLEEEDIIEPKPGINMEDNPYSEIPLGQHNTFHENATFTHNEPESTNFEIAQIGSSSRNGSQSEFSVGEDDADMLFLKSLHKDLVKLSNSRKRRFKIEMMTGLFNHLEEDEKINL